MVLKMLLHDFDDEGSDCNIGCDLHLFLFIIQLWKIGIFYRKKRGCKKKMFFEIGIENVINLSSVVSFLV